MVSFGCYSGLWEVIWLFETIILCLPSMYDLFSDRVKSKEECILFTISEFDLYWNPYNGAAAWADGHLYKIRVFLFST